MKTVVAARLSLKRWVVSDRMKNFFKPTRMVLVIWLCLLFIAGWASIDSWRFHKVGNPPMLYEFISQNPITPVIWGVSFFILIPAYPLTFVFALVFPQTIGNPYWGSVYIIPYLYLLSCFFSWGIIKVKNRGMQI